MGKVDCLSVGKCECTFYSSDHRPAHFHVSNLQEGWGIRAYIETTTSDYLHYDFCYPKSKQSINVKIEKEIRDKIVRNRDALLKEWSEKVCEE